MSDKDLIDLLGLTDRKLEVGIDLEQDMLYVMENGIDKYLQEVEAKEKKRKEFIQLFKECFDELCIFMEKDPKRRVSVNCLTCIKGMNLRDQYGKSQK